MAGAVRVGAGLAALIPVDRPLPGAGLTFALALLFALAAAVAAAAAATALRARITGARA